MRVCHGVSGGNTNVQGCFIQLSDVFDESDVLGRQSRTGKELCSDTLMRLRRLVICVGAMLFSSKEQRFHDNCW